MFKSSPEYEFGYPQKISSPTNQIHILVNFLILIISEIKQFKL